MYGEWKMWTDGLQITDYNKEVGGTSADAMPVWVWVHAGWSSQLLSVSSSRCIHLVCPSMYYTVT